MKSLFHLLTVTVLLGSVGCIDAKEECEKIVDAQCKKAVSCGTVTDAQCREIAKKTVDCSQAKTVDLDNVEKCIAEVEKSACNAGKSPDVCDKAIMK